MVDHESLVEAIYEAAAIPEQWPAVLEKFGRAVDTPRVALLTRRSDSWMGYAVTKVGEALLLGYLQTDIPARSQTTGRLLAADRAGFIREDQIFSLDEWEHDPYRREWCRPHGWNHCAATAIAVPSGDFLVVHAQRLEGEDPLSQREIAHLDLFRPHLARAGMMAARWRMQRLQTATEALCLIGLPAAVLDRDRRVLAANQLIQDLRGHVRWSAQNRFALADPKADELLQSALAGLFSLRKGTVQSFASRSTATGMSIVHIVPTTGHARDIFDGGLAIVVLTPVGTPAAPETTVIRGLFDLSAGEARIAKALTEGHSIDRIARQSGVTRETVRTQVKAVLAKTGTTRQAEAAALLAGLPRLPPSSGERQDS
jgi:DNA-binding CsgD family transcriptional regulator